MANTGRKLVIKIDVDVLLDSLRDKACIGIVSYIVPGFPGEIHIKEATGEAPKIEQRVLIVPIDD